jgi:hypothetical protein
MRSFFQKREVRVESSGKTGPVRPTVMLLYTSYDTGPIVQTLMGKLACYSPLEYDAAQVVWTYPPSKRKHSLGCLFHIAFVLLWLKLAMKRRFLFSKEKINMELSRNFFGYMAIKSRKKIHATTGHNKY